MQLRARLRRQIIARLCDQQSLTLTSEPFALEPHFQGIEAFGLYLHIPFCRQICPYCPYNKVLYNSTVATRYADAVMRECDQYAELVADRPVTSLYIGGGTPTTMLHNGLDRVLSHIRQVFKLQCGIHLESHPNDLSADNLAAIAALGVDNLSIGVEALDDRELHILGRTYSAAEAKAAITRAVQTGFDCINVDLIFALPDQTLIELRQAARILVDQGVDQVATYPLFTFPYTHWSQFSRRHGYRRHSLLRKRQMLRVLEEVLYGAGYARTSVWAFTRPGTPNYCSVTVPLYLGLGASAGSYLRDVFYLNTFHVRDYIETLEAGRKPIALSLALSPQMQMAGWLYWRVYETRFSRRKFAERFGRDFDAVYGRYLRALCALGLVSEQGDEIALTDAGSFWLHALQDLFSIDYVAKLWGRSQEMPWPKEVSL